jgi:hypothetical protein
VAAERRSIQDAIFTKVQAARYTDLRQEYESGMFVNVGSHSMVLRQLRRGEWR